MRIKATLYCSSDFMKLGLTCHNCSNCNERELQLPTTKRATASTARKKWEPQTQSIPIVTLKSGNWHVTTAMSWVAFNFSLVTSLPMSYAIWILIHTELLSRCVQVWNFNRIETKCVEFGQSTIYFSAFHIQLLKTATAPNASNTSQRVGTNFVLSSDTIIFMQPSTCVCSLHSSRPSNRTKQAHSWEWEPQFSRAWHV